MTRLDDGIPVDTVDVVEGLEGCHSANISPDNRTLWVPALKQDRICLFTLSDDGHLVAQNPAEVTTVEGAAPFADEAKISTWARQAVHALAAAGYMKGGNYNMFNPKQYVTRGEAVNVLYRIMTGVKVTNQSQDNLEDKALPTLKTSTVRSKPLPMTASCTGRATAPHRRKRC